MKQCVVCQGFFKPELMHLTKQAGGVEVYFCIHCRDTVLKALEENKCWNCGHDTTPAYRRLIWLREKLECVCFSCHKRMYLDEYDKSRETVRDNQCSANTAVNR